MARLLVQTGLPHSRRDSLSYLAKPTRVPWPALQAQFGADYSDRKDFKRRFIRAMRQVLILYPAARVEQVRGGLLLKPSPSHVKRQLEA